MFMSSQDENRAAIFVQFSQQGSIRNAFSHIRVVDSTQISIKKFSSGDERSCGRRECANHAKLLACIRWIYTKLYTKSAVKERSSIALAMISTI